MEGCVGRPHTARAFARLYRPMRASGPLRALFDRTVVRFWTRLDVGTYRRLGVSLGVRALGVRDVLILRTRGRKTGRVRSVIVAYFDQDGDVCVCGANAGFERAPSWMANLRAGGPVEYERHRQRVAARPVMLEGEAYDRAYGELCQRFPHVAYYRTRTARTFPIVRLVATGQLPATGALASSPILAASPL